MITHYAHHSELIFEVKIKDSEWVAISSAEVIGMTTAAIVRAMSYNPTIIGLLGLIIEVSKPINLKVKHYIHHSLLAREDITPNKIEEIKESISNTINELVNKEYHKGNQWNQKTQMQA